jgi:hypothetical protein
MQQLSNDYIMLTGLLILALVGLLGALTHRRSRLENKIYKNVPLSEWLVVLILPVSLYLGWFFIVDHILERPKTTIFPLDDFDIIAITILFMIYGFVGNAIHFTGKILWRYLRKNPKAMAYRINEMFHGKLSHYLVFLNGMMIAFLLAVLEFNHPIQLGVTSAYSGWVVLGAIVFGISGSKAVFYSNEWFGGYNKPLFFVISALLSILFLFYRIYNLKFIFYPVNLFIISLGVAFLSTFVFRQVFIFTKLGQKRRLRFLAKFLSV